LRLCSKEHGNCHNAEEQRDYNAGWFNQVRKIIAKLAWCSLLLPSFGNREQRVRFQRLNASLFTT
jgi:hypothetical protein